MIGGPVTAILTSDWSGPGLRVPQHHVPARERGGARRRHDHGRRGPALPGQSLCRRQVTHIFVIEYFFYSIRNYFFQKILNMNNIFVMKISFLVWIYF